MVQKATDQEELGESREERILKRKKELIAARTDAQIRILEAETAAKRELLEARGKLHPLSQILEILFENGEKILVSIAVLVFLGLVTFMILHAFLP